MVSALRRRGGERLFENYNVFSRRPTQPICLFRKRVEDATLIILKGLEYFVVRDVGKLCERLDRVYPTQVGELSKLGDDMRTRKPGAAGPE